MDEDGEHAVPAASIGDTDLSAVAQSNPGAAMEIARLEQLMNRGEESKGDFLRLCQLLYDVGSVANSEYLLRRNVNCEEGMSLYKQLFRTTKQDEYEMAIDAFKSQFAIDLTLIEPNDFLDTTFHSDGGPSRLDEFQLLSGPCEVRIEYSERDKIGADVVLLDPTRTMFNADECLLMFFVNGVWEIVDPLID